MSVTSLSQIKQDIEEYTQHPKLNNPVALFIGATNGIGLNTILDYAKATINCDSITIYIGGRDQTKGESVIADIKKINPKATVHFLLHNMVYVKEAKKLADTVKSKETQLNLVFISSGGFPKPGRNETSEGLDRRVAVSFYTRWMVISELAPLLQSTALANPKAPVPRVVTVLACGNEAKAESLNTSDFGLKNEDSVLRVISVNPAYNTMCCNLFSQKYPNVSFIHTMPGIVNTGVFRGTPWYIQAIAPVFLFFLQNSQEDTGLHHLYAALVAPEFDTPGAYYPDFMKNNMKLIHLQEERSQNGLFSKELEEKLWEDTQNVYKHALST